MKTEATNRVGGKHTWKRAGPVFVLYLLASITASAQKFTTLYNFDSTVGGNPWAALVQGTNGGLYGTVTTFGAYNGGAIFEIGLETGTLTTLYSFCSQINCEDGAVPTAPLIWATNGHFYGTTDKGGTNGMGTVFKMTPSGEFTSVLSFDGTNGNDPLGLIQGTDGNFYGTTALGGSKNFGTIFKMTSSGTLTTLYSFCEQHPCTDGAYPAAGLVEGADGNFYGTTAEGGQGSACQGTPPEGCGTVFRITPAGVLTVLYSFCGTIGCPDGVGGSLGPLILGSTGDFYGTTYAGGINGYGTVFEVSRAGELTTLYSFCSQENCTDGAHPWAALVLGDDGNLYGTTELGGAFGSLFSETGGTAFKFTLNGALTTLYSFCSQSNCADGSEPIAALVQDTNGKLYGTTYGGGTSTTCTGPGCGTVFSLSLGLGEFVSPDPSSGRVGSAIDILGTGLGDASSVTFNHTPAQFKISSGSLITTTVPVGATTGVVEVVTPHGTIRSNVRFRVLK